MAEQVVTPQADAFDLIAVSFAQVSRLHQAQDITTVMAAFREVLEQILGALDFVIYLRDATTEDMVQTLVHGNPPLPLAPEFFEADEINSYGEPVAVVPLRSAGGRSLGLVIVTQLMGARPQLTGDEQQLYEVFQKHASLALTAAMRLRESEDKVSELLSRLGSDAQALALPAAATVGPFKGALLVQAGSLLALPIQNVVEVCQMIGTCGDAPDSSDGCVGFIEHRGQFIPLFDLRACLKHDKARSENELVDAYVVIIDEGARFACVVDGLMGMFEAEDAREVALPTINNTKANRVTTAVVSGGSPVPLIKSLRILVNHGWDDMEAVMHAASQSAAGGPA